MSYCIDYLSFTIKHRFDNYDDVIEMLADVLPANVLEDTDLNNCFCETTKRFGYSKSIIYKNGLQIYFDGRSTKNEMGTHVVIPGSTLNNTSILNSQKNIFDWVMKIKSYKYDYKIARLDVANDSDLKFGYFLNKIRNREFISKSQKIRFYIDENDVGTVYLGARQGNIMWRIYDKNNCNKDKGLAYMAEGDWTRVEAEFKNQLADGALNEYVKGNINQVFKGHLMFVEKRVKNMSRDAVECQEYLKILENPEEKIVLKFKRIDDETDEWFYGTVLPNVKAYQKIYGKNFINYLLAKIEPSNNTIEKLQQREKVLQNRLEQNAILREVV